MSSPPNILKSIFALKSDSTEYKERLTYGMLPIFEVFQNRFAVRSYGGLVPQLTRHDFFLGVSALRNPELMRILKDLELVEALGFGIRGITKIYDKDIFEFTDNSLYVTFPFEEKSIAKSKGEISDNTVYNQKNNENKSKEENEVVPKEIQQNFGLNFGLNETQKEIIALIKENAYITQKEISAKLNLSTRNIEYSFNILTHNRIIERIGTKKSGFWALVDDDKSEKKTAKVSKGKIKKSKVESKVEHDGFRGIIIQLMKRNPSITVAELAEKSGLSISGIEKNIRQLKKEGKIYREGATKKGEWTVIKSKSK